MDYQPEPVPISELIRRGVCTEEGNEMVDTLEVILPVDDEAIVRIRESGDEQGTSFFDFLSYEVEGHEPMSVDSVAFRTQTHETGRPTALSFVLLGNSVPQDYFISYFAVTHVSFSGHFSYVTPAFEIISQLVSLSSVTFHLTKSQQPFFLEKKGDTDLSGLRIKSFVKKLVVIAESCETDLHLTNKLLEVIFSRVEVCLPALKQIHLQLPLVPVAKKTFLRLLQNSITFQESSQSLSYSVPFDHATPTLMCSYMSMSTAIATPWDILGNRYSLDDCPKCYKDYYENHFAKRIIEAAFDKEKARWWVPNGDNDVTSNNQGTHQSPPERHESSNSYTPAWEPANLQVCCGFYIPDESPAKPNPRVFAPCTNKGRDLLAIPEVLGKLAVAVSSTRHYQKQLMEPSHIKNVQATKARNQGRVARVPRGPKGQAEQKKFSPFPRFPRSMRSEFRQFVIGL